jgi:hypothetical protein
MWTSPHRDATDAASTISSVTSTFRHAQFAPPHQKNKSTSVNQSKLMTDASHTPKTHGSFGLLVVGLGGANGTTMLCGILANRLGIEWHGPKGEPMTPNYNGCITQLKQRGVHGGVGYKDLVKGLADASMAAVGGWVRLISYLFYFILFSSSMRKVGCYCL